MLQPEPIHRDRISHFARRLADPLSAAMASCCSGSMLPLRFRRCSVSRQSSHLRTSHRPIIRAAVKSSPCVAVRSGFPLLQAYWGKSSDIGGGDIGGGGGIAGGGGEDDMSIDGFRVLDGIVRLLRHLLKLGGALKEQLLVGDLLSTMNCWISIISKDNVECQPSSGMDAINPVGAEPSSCNGKNDEKHTVIPTVLNCTTNSMSSYSYKNTGTETMRMRATSTPIHRVIGIPDNENDSDANEKKMKGKHGFVFYTAVGSLAYALGIAAHWTLCCSNTPLSIFGTWMGTLPVAHAAVTFTSLILIGAASNFKDGELPDNHGFKALRTVQLLVLLWLWAATFIPLHVCRGISNSVVWSFASAALCATVVTWIAIFQLTKMVIKHIKIMFKEVTEWLGKLSLPECITAKFKKVRGTQRGQSQPMETV